MADHVRTQEIVSQALSAEALPATPGEIAQGVATQIFGVVGGSDIPLVWSFAHSLPLQLAMVVPVPGILAPIASIYLAVWVAIGGRGRLYGSVIGAALVSLLPSGFTSGGVPSVPLGFYTIDWVDWWKVLLGLSFVLVTLFAPKGIGGLFGRFQGLHSPDRKGAPPGPDDGSLQEKEAVE